MMRFAAVSVLAVVGGLSAGPCGGEEPVQVKLGEPFELGIGKTASVEDGDLVLTFLSVPQDSRCPKGEQCITAGKAIVRLEAVPRGGAPVTIDLDTTGESGESDASGFQITLRELSAAPKGRPMNFQDYLVTLSVSRL
jgi:hypothetical protein